MDVATTSVTGFEQARLEHTFADELPELAVPWQGRSWPQPELLVLNEALAADLGLDPAGLRSPAGVAVLAGSAAPEGAVPVAQGYAGHQFGGLSPRLGDGRALLVGEIVDAAGGRWDLHLKGSGPTPFSRGGDGKAALGPMLREYVIGEAMHALGIPTTRALAVVATGDVVAREELLPGAVLARVAASHLRVGSFQYAALEGGPELVRRLADHAIARHHPAAAEAPNRYLALLELVVEAQASLVARWMLVGFVHGVMNTDNTTISGETIDYGPCAFMDRFDPGTVFSSIDHGGRYAFGNQPAIAQWNLARLAETLLPLLDDDEDRAVASATQALERFAASANDHWLAGMRAKLGIDGAADGTATLVTDLLTLLHAQQVDFTSFFRALAQAARGDGGALDALVAEPGALDGWLDPWRALLPVDPAGAAAVADRMDDVNPRYVPRNHKVEEALAAATAGDLAPLHRLVDVVTRPFEERPGLEEYASPAPPSPEPYRTFCGT